MTSSSACISTVSTAHGIRLIVCVLFTQLDGEPTRHNSTSTTLIPAVLSLSVTGIVIEFSMRFSVVVRGSSQKSLLYQSAARQLSQVAETVTRISPLSLNPFMVIVFSCSISGSTYRFGSLTLTVVYCSTDCKDMAWFQSKDAIRSALFVSCVMI